MEIKVKDGRTWVLLFRHFTYNKPAKYFANYDSSFHTTTNKDLFSLLTIINELMKVNGKYEFLLEYPELNNYFHWRQTSNPLSVSSSVSSSTIGFEPIHVPSNYFKGLGLGSSTTSGLLGICDGECGWHYAIGCHNNLYDPKFPGPDINGDFYYVKQALLWIRSTNRVTCIFNQRKISIVHNIILAILSQ
jgi:hypothetical protein